MNQLDRFISSTDGLQTGVVNGYARKERSMKLYIWSTRLFIRPKQSSVHYTGQSRLFFTNREIFYWALRARKRAEHLGSINGWI